MKAGEQRQGLGAQFRALGTAPRLPMSPRPHGIARAQGARNPLWNPPGCRGSLWGRGEPEVPYGTLLGAGQAATAPVQHQQKRKRKNQKPF